MDLSETVLGATAVSQLRERTLQPVLTVGADRFTRADLATTSCFNFVAAQNLSNALDELGVKSTQDLYNRVPPAALALPRVGVFALAVLGAAFEHKGIGGDHPLENWMLHHRGEASKDHAIRTFHSVKRKQIKAQLQENRDRKRRKQVRRDRAHRLRSERFLSRTQGAA